MWANEIMATLFLCFFVWLFVGQFTQSLCSLGYRIQAWIRLALFVLLMTAFGLAYLFPREMLNPFR